MWKLECGSDWGWFFLLFLSLGAAGYVGGFVAYNHKSRGMPLDKAALPHPAFWGEVKALVEDGAAFVKARASGGGDGGGGYTKVAEAGAPEEPQVGSEKGGEKKDAESAAAAPQAVPKDLFEGLDNSGSDSDGDDDVVE